MNKPKLPFDTATIEYDNKNYATDFVLHIEPEQKESYIEGKILAERMKEKGLSASVLDYLMENTEKIPEDWKGKYVYFWGTIFRNSNGDLYVRYLCFSRGKWQTDCNWLDNYWLINYPAAVSASPLSLDTKTSSGTLNLDLAIKICKDNGLKVIREKKIIQEL